MFERNWLGMALFISSEAIFFGALILTYLVHRTGVGATTLVPLLEVPRTALFSLALFASSGTMELAHRRFDRGDRRGFRRWLLATAGLGAVFLVGQALEYVELLERNVGLAAGIVPSAFYTLTGFHGLHVIAGLALILALWSVAGAEGFLRRHPASLPPVALYWHFVDVVWVVIFLVVYGLTVL